MYEPEKLAGWRRFTLKMVENAGKNDPEAFAAIAAILEEAQAAMSAAAAELRAPVNGRPGHSWADIGRALGVSRQAAHKRYGTVEAVAS